MHDFMALDRHGKPEEVASMISYLASDDAAFVTGANIAVDGVFSPSLPWSHSTRIQRVLSRKARLS